MTHGDPNPGMRAWTCSHICPWCDTPLAKCDHYVETDDHGSNLFEISAEELVKNAAAKAA